MLLFILVYSETHIFKKRLKSSVFFLVYNIGFYSLAAIQSKKLTVYMPILTHYRVIFKIL